MRLTVYLPVLGIVAFSLCSTWSLFNLFYGRATHPTPLYWLPAVLVELVTAWIVAQVVGQIRNVTKSNLSKQDRRFFAIILTAFVLVAGPLVGVSVWANALEFSSLVLGVLFPVSSIGCAVGAALPDAVQKFEKRKEKERKEQAEERRKKAEAKAKEAEERRKAAEAAQREAEARAKAQAERRRMMEKMGRSAEVFALIEAEPALTQDEIGERLGITRQTVGYHIDKLAAMGALPSDGNGKDLVRGA